MRPKGILIVFLLYTVLALAACLVWPGCRFPCLSAWGGMVIVALAYVEGYEAGLAFSQGSEDTPCQP